MKQLTGKDRALYLERVNRRKAFEEFRWYVIRTLSNQEERVADIFRSYNIEVFIPKAHQGWIEAQDNTHLIYPKLIYVYISLEMLRSIMWRYGWPSYMSICLDRTRPHVNDWRQFLTVSNESMDIFKNATSCLSNKGCTFSLGDEVQITDGLWTGHSGVVKDINPTQRLALIEGTINNHIRFSARVSFNSMILCLKTE